MRVKCPYCGFENPDTSSFCGNCAQNTLDGYNTKNAKIQRIHKKPQYDDAVKAKASGCFAILGILLFVGVFLFVFISEETSKTSGLEGEITETTMQSISMEKFGLPTVDYIYSVGMTENPDTGMIDLNVYTKNKRFKLTEKDGVLKSKSVFVKFDLFAGVTDDGETFTVNKDYIKIGDTKYAYEESLKHLISMSEILSVAVDDLYVWFFTGELTVMSAKRNEKQLKLKYEHVKAATQIGEIYGAYYQSDKRIMFTTNGATIYRLEFGKLGTFEYKDKKEYTFENKEEAVIALAAYGKSFVFITRNYNNKSQNLYVTTVDEMDRLFR